MEHGVWDTEQDTREPGAINKGIQGMARAAKKKSGTPVVWQVDRPGAKKETGRGPGVITYY